MSNYDPFASSNYRHLNLLDGRWVASDLAKEAGGINLYCFVANNPSTYSDVFGLISITLDDAKLAPEKISPDLKVKGHFIAGRSGYGYADYSEHKIACTNSCKNENGHKSYKIESCKVSAKAVIVLRNDFSKNILRGLYGHEQRHIKARIAQVNKEILEPISAMKSDYGTDQKAFNEAYNKITFSFTTKLRKILSNTGKDMHGKDGHPNTYSLYPPLPGSVWGEPPDKGDLYPKVNEPYKWEEIADVKDGGSNESK